MAGAPPASRAGFAGLWESQQTAWQVRLWQEEARLWRAPERRPLPVAEHRSTAKTKPKPEIARRPQPVATLPLPAKLRHTVARPVLNRAHRRARLLRWGGAVGGVLALLGAWLAIRGPHASVQGRSGVSEILMVTGLGIAFVCGLLAALSVGLGVIMKLDSQRRPVRLKDPK